MRAHTEGSSQNRSGLVKEKGLGEGEPGQDSDDSVHGLMGRPSGWRLPAGSGLSMCWFLCTCASPGAAAQPPLSPEAVTPKAAVFHGCSVCRGTPFRAEWCGPRLSASLRAGPCLWLLSVAVCGLLGRECGGVGAGVRRGEVCLTPLGSAEVRGGEGLGIRPQVRLSVEEIARCRNAIPWAPWLPRPTPPRLGVRD